MTARLVACRYWRAFRSAGAGRVYLRNAEPIACPSAEIAATAVASTIGNAAPTGDFACFRSAAACGMYRIVTGRRPSTAGSDACCERNADNPAFLQAMPRERRLGYARCGHVGLLHIDPAENGLPCPWLFGTIAHPPAPHASYCVRTRMDLPAGPPTTFARTRQMRDSLMADGSKLIVSYVPQRTVASYKEEGGK